MNKKIFGFLALFLVIASILFSRGISAKNNSSQTLTLEEEITNSNGRIHINEVMFYPSEGDFEWIELKNSGNDAIDISGYLLTDEDGNEYQFPLNLPEVPSNAFVVVLFDGLGSTSNDLDFGDNMVILHSHSGLVDIFEDQADQVALYGLKRYDSNIFLPLVINQNSISSLQNSAKESNSLPSGYNLTTSELEIISFVAWGTEPKEDATNALENNLWFEDLYVFVSSDDSFKAGQIYENETIGLLPDFQNSIADYWTLYVIDEVTQGSENPLPSINTFYPAPGNTEDSKTFGVSWNFVSENATYHFQLDNESTFISPEIDEILLTPYYLSPEPMPEGRYFWRVKVINNDNESSWSPAIEVFSIASPEITSMNSPEDIVITDVGILWDIEWKLQRKDTNMLCMNGDREDGLGAWDIPHPNDSSQRFSHGSMYCSRASLSMLASYYGEDLSQDRIAYEDCKETSNPLGHGIGNCHDMYNSSETDLLTLVFGEGVFTPTFSIPSYQTIKNKINNDQPILVHVSRYGRGDIQGPHFAVIGGFIEWESNGQTIEQIYLLDPWDSERWPVYDEYDNFILTYYVGPSSLGSLRISDDIDGDGDKETMVDSDGDGICDFDEEVRFETSKNDPDSDSDKVLDKDDMRGYLFNNIGSFSRNDADYDHDTLRKEVDPDNDGGGALDGCEDSNLNGKLDSGETSNFNPSDDEICEPSLDEMVYVSAGQFQMGCDPNHNGGYLCSSDELPLHTVYLNSFWIDSTEVTNAQYAQCVDTGGCNLPYELIFYADPDRKDQPVVYVNWDMADTYCEWADKRLPTEAEWEKAARGANDTRAFPWGDQSADSTLANLLYPEPKPVGSYPLGVSPYGIFDMAGNVWEFVQDWFDSSYYSISPPSNPPGPVTGTSKVLRGGGFYDFTDEHARVASRTYTSLSHYNFVIGFRCASDSQ